MFQNFESCVHGSGPIVGPGFRAENRTHPEKTAPYVLSGCVRFPARKVGAFLVHVPGGVCACSVLGGLAVVVASVLLLWLLLVLVVVVAVVVVVVLLVIILVSAWLSLSQFLLKPAFCQPPGWCGLPYTDNDDDIDKDIDKDNDDNNNDSGNDNDNHGDSDNDYDNANDNDNEHDDDNGNRRPRARSPDLARSLARSSSQN